MTAAAFVRKVGERAGDVRAAWRLGPTRQGLAGTVLIWLGSLTPAYLPQNSPWWIPLRALRLDSTPMKIVGTVMVLAGIGLLVSGWFRLRPSVYRDVKHWAVLFIWSVPFLVAPPIFSHDAYSYAAQGWMLINGINPYEAGPGVLPGAFADQVAWVWRYTPAPYGPASLQVQHFLVWLSGASPYWSTMLMRIPALVGVWLIVVLLPRIAHRLKVDVPYTAWFATLNPLLVIDFVGGMHNDSIMVGLVVLAIWLALKPRLWLLGAAIVGVAAAVKQPAFLAAYVLPLLLHPLASWRWGDVLRTGARILASCAISIAAFVGVSLASGLGFGWLNAVNVPGLVVTISPFTIIGQGLQWVLNFFDLDSTRHNAIRYSRTVGLVIAAVGTLVMAVTVARRRPLRFLSWSYLLIAFCTPALHSWYVLWGGVLLPLAEPGRKTDRAAVLVTIALLSYSAINLAWRNGALALGIAALALFAWQWRAHDRHHHRPKESLDA